MKSKGFNILFRIILILTFVAGMVYLIEFVRLVGAPAEMTEEQFLSACRRWTYIFIVYLFMCVGSSALKKTSARLGSDLLGTISYRSFLFVPKFCICISS